MDEIIQLVENDIPECQQTLKNNHRNLERVAEYCDRNYFKSQNKLAALEETKNYATQSLASVAYQIASLSFNILHLLEFQAGQMSEMESKVNHLAQAEQIYYEKVARREIGLFTANKRPVRFPKIMSPPTPERPVKYAHKNIDYTVLNHVGHGMKQQYIEKVVALYDYTKEKPDELNLRENDIIYVTKKNEDGWYQGIRDGEEGLFPYNYVQVIHD